MNKETATASKVQKQRIFMAAIVDKLNVFAETSDMLQSTLLNEFNPSKIESLFNEEKLSSEELLALQITMFSRLLVAEKRLSLFQHVLMEILPVIWELKQVVEEKQKGGPNTKKLRDVARGVWIKSVMEEKSLPKAKDFLENLQLAVTGKKGASKDGKYVVHQRTIDNLLKQFKVEMVDAYLSKNN